MNDNLIPLNVYNSVYEAYIHPELLAQYTFEEIVYQFKEAQSELKIKEDGMLFNCCTWVKNFTNPPEDKFNQDKSFYPREELIRRCKENVDHIYCLLLDVDGTMTLEQTIDKWKEYEFLIYSTHSNSIEKEKFRLIVPLRTALSMQEFDERHDSMCTAFNVDGASFTISQAFYLPSYSADNKDIAFVYWNESDTRYDALPLSTVPITINPTLTAPTGATTAITNSIYRTLITGSDLHYADALALAVLCKSKGLTEANYIDIVKTIAAPDSALRTSAVSLSNLYSQGFNAYMKNDTAIKLMQKLHCDMWRFVKLF
jgi:hypothetical protein